MARIHFKMVPRRGSSVRDKERSSSFRCIFHMYVYPAIVSTEHCSQIFSLKLQY